jgi:hypothetical protein
MYFEEQLKSAEPLTAEDVAVLVERRWGLFSKTDPIEVQAFKDLVQYHASYIGKKRVYYMLFKDNDIVEAGVSQHKIELRMIFENEISTLSDFEFIGMEGKYPQFKYKAIKLPIIKNVEYMQTMAKNRPTL